MSLFGDELDKSSPLASPAALPAFHRAMQNCMFIHNDKEA